MVPTLRCGFVLSNFALAIYLSFLPVPVLPGKDRTVAALPRGLRPRQPIAFAGAHNRIRTDDLALTKGVLCQLSYVGVFPSLPSRKDSDSISAHPNHRTFLLWCQGQDSNLRSPSGQRFYRPSVLATHPPWQRSSLVCGAAALAGRYLV